MSDTATTTIISDSYALFGTKTVGPPDRPDKSSAEREAERKADRIEYRQLLREMHWTAPDYEQAKLLGIVPTKALYGVTHDVRYGFASASYEVHSREEINVRLAKFWAFSTKVPKRL